ncbi:MAG: zinc-binding dehydrogenase [Planctomycetes bacterium]|nr:zinc-binding dehydrogenase [Planctomycetota bacterium]
MSGKCAARACSAAPDVGIATLRPRGTIVIFSYIWQPRAVDMGLIHMRELNVLGSCRSLSAYRKCLDLMATGAIDTGALVDIQAPLEDYVRVFDRLVSDKKNTFKAVFLPQN